MNDAVWFAFAFKSTLVLGAAWLIAAAMRRNSAAARHLVWTAASAAVLALPLLSVSLPALRVPSFMTLASGVDVLFQTNATARPEDASTIAPRGPARSQSQPWRLDWRRAVLLLWAIGAAASIVQMLVAFVGVWRIRSSARPWSLTHELAPVPVLETEAGTMPMTCGFLKPAVLLPQDAGNWSEERRSMVLLHELAHVRRGDVATNLLARLALILNWWNPLAWLGWREFLKERERAADDLVLSTGARPSDYAGHLLEIARGMRTTPALAWAAVAMARRSELEGRLIAILDPRVNRKAAGRASMFAVLAVAVALIAPFAAVRAQDPASQAIPSDIDATIRAAIAQNNFDMLDKPAEALEAARQFDSAKKLLDASLTIRERVYGATSRAYGIGVIQLADLEKNRNQSKQAVALYLQAVQILGDKPEAAPALLFLGIDQLGKKEYSHAIDYFSKAQNVDSRRAAAAQMWTALAREREGSSAEADASYRSALALAEPDSDQAATTMALYSRFLETQGRNDEASAMQARVAEIRHSPVPASGTPKIVGGITPPKVVSKFEPQYTEEARVVKWQGTVSLWLEIGTDGIAHNIHVTRSLGFGLDQNAIAAVQQWRFSPATNKLGEPTAVQAQVEVNFRLL